MSGRDEVDLGRLSASEATLLSRPQGDSDRMSWLDGARVYMQSNGPMRNRGEWFIHYDAEDGAWVSGLVMREGGPYVEETHSTLREAIDRVHP